MFVKRKILGRLEKNLSLPEATVLTGFRRVGKTTLVKHLYDNLKTDNKIFLDMESPVNQQIFQRRNYDAIVVELKKLGIRLNNKPFVFLDEVQSVKNIPSIVKYLFDHYQIKFVLTGSSSFYLKNHFTESLSGRKFLFELNPLDFEEYLWFKGEKTALDADYELLRHLYDEYVNFGGLPGVVLEADVENKQLRLDDALGSYFQLDVVKLASFRDIKDLQSLLFLLAPRAGSKIDVTKLSQSLGVSRQTLYNYLEFLEATYLISLLPAYSGSADVQTRRIPKLYFKDSGLLNRVGKIALGSVFENTVYNQLCLSKKKISYFQKKSGAEIDFIADGVGYEVKLTATEADAARLSRFAGRLKLNDYFVISLGKTRAKNARIIYPFKI